MVEDYRRPNGGYMDAGDLVTPMGEEPTDSRSRTPLGYGAQSYTVSGTGGNVTVMNRQHVLMDRFKNERTDRAKSFMGDDGSRSAGDDLSYRQPRTAKSMAARSNRSQKPKKEGYFLDKVVLITGASSGVGRSLAYWYLNNGARVALAARDIN